MATKGFKKGKGILVMPNLKRRSVTYCLASGKFVSTGPQAYVPPVPGP